jgi:hypothetical protein
MFFSFNKEDSELPFPLQWVPFSDFCIHMNMFDNVAYLLSYIHQKSNECWRQQHILMSLPIMSVDVKGKKGKAIPVPGHGGP